MKGCQINSTNDNILQYQQALQFQLRHWLEKNNVQNSPPTDTSGTIFSMIPWKFKSICYILKSRPFKKKWSGKHPYLNRLGLSTFASWARPAYAMKIPSKPFPAYTTPINTAKLLNKDSHHELLKWWQTTGTIYWVAGLVPQTVATTAYLDIQLFTFLTLVFVERFHCKTINLIPLQFMAVWMAETTTTYLQSGTAGSGIQNW